MAPLTTSIWNSGTVHVSCVAAVFYARQLRDMAKDLALDLHLLLGSEEKMILVHYFNLDNISFEKPCACIFNFLVCFLSPLLLN